MSLFLVTIFCLACLTSMVLTVLVSGVAARFGLTDRPDGRRKLHAGPIPLGGGIAVFLATAAVLVTLHVVFGKSAQRPFSDWFDILTFLAACATVVAVGTVDDRVALRGRHKLLGQVLAASMLMAGGLMIRRVGIFGYHVDLGLLALPFTLFWLVGAVNAVNLLDGIDGLATTLGIISSAAICVMAAFGGYYSVSIIAAAFAGSLFGFLRFNFPPAKVYLGDAGSMLIGLVVGALAIRGALKGPGTVLLAAPLAIWAIPIFDSLAAILRRKLTGRSIYAPDRGHLHHRLMDRVGSNRKVLGFIAVCCALTSLAALASTYLKNDLIAVTTCAAVVVIFVASGVFGRIELVLLAGRIYRIGRTLIHPVAVPKKKAHAWSIRPRGSRQWGALWETLTAAADELRLVRIDLDVNLPAAQEEYTASWERPQRYEDDPCWRVELPLAIAGGRIGQLTVVGEQNGELPCEDIEQLLGLLAAFERQLLTIIEQKMPVTAGDDATNERSETGLRLTRTHPR